MQINNLQETNYLTQKDYLITVEHETIAKKIWSKIESKISPNQRKHGRIKLIQTKLIEKGYNYPTWYLKECFHSDLSKRRWNHIVMECAEKYLVPKVTTVFNTSKATKKQTV